MSPAASSVPGLALEWEGGCGWCWGEGQEAGTGQKDQASPGGLEGPAEEGSVQGWVGSVWTLAGGVSRCGLGRASCWEMGVRTWNWGLRDREFWERWGLAGAGRLGCIGHAGRALDLLPGFPGGARLCLSMQRWQLWCGVQGPVGQQGLVRASTWAGLWDWCHTWLQFNH